MALGFRTGTFVKPTSATGLQVVPVDGAAFDVKILLIMGVGRTATGFTDGALMSKGFTDGVNQAVRSVAWADNLPSSDCVQAQSQSRLVWGLNPVGDATLFSAAIDSLGNGEFTLNWTVNDGVAGRVFRYVAVGGDAVTDVLASSFTSPATSGAQTQAVTGVGFQADGIIFLPFFSGSAEQVFDGGSLHGFGFATATESVTAYALSRDNRAAGDGYRRQRSDRCVSVANVTGGTNPIIGDPGIEGRVLAIGADGFTMSWSFIAASPHTFFSYQMPFLAFKGPRVKVGTFLQKIDGLGLQATSTGFVVAGLLVESVGVAPGTTTQTTAKMAVGAADGVRQGCDWVGELNGPTTIVTACYHSTTSVAVTGDAVAAGASSTKSAEAGLDEFPLVGEGFILDYTKADAAGREFLYLALGDPAEAEVPTVRTLTPVRGGLGTAVLRGAATPRGVAIDGYFRWGTDNPPTEHDTAPQALGAGADEVAYTAEIDGLEQDVQYYARAVIDT